MNKYKKVLCASIIISTNLFGGCTSKENPKIMESTKVPVQGQVNKPVQTTDTLENDRLGIIKDADKLPNLEFEIKRSHFVEVDGWLFYYKSQAWHDGETWSGEAGIYKIKIDGTVCKKIIDLSGLRDPYKHDTKYIITHADDCYITSIDTLQVGQGYVWFTISNDQIHKQNNSPAKMYNEPIGDEFPAQAGVQQLSFYSESELFMSDDLVEPIVGQVVRDHFAFNDNYMYWYKEQYICPHERFGEAGIYRKDRKTGKVDRIALTSDNDISKYDRNYLLQHKDEFKISSVQDWEVSGDTIMYKYYDSRIFKQKIGSDERVQIPKWK